MTIEQKPTLGIKDRNKTPVAFMPGDAAIRFRTREGALAVLLPQCSRTLHDGHVTSSDAPVLPYQHAATRAEILPTGVTAAIAERILTDLKKTAAPIRTGMELEGTIYSIDGKHMLPVHDGVNVTFADAPPERQSSQLEVVTGKTEQGQLPGTPIEIARALGEAIMKGIDIAQRRNGMYVISSVPEGGSASEVALTQHEYIESAYQRGQTRIHPATPQEAREICEQVGLDDIIPFNGLHRHTSNPRLETGLYSSRLAYAKGITRLTQMAQIASFSLFNTTHLVGEKIDGVRDVRSVIRRTTGGAHGSPYPKDAYELVENAVRLVEEGKTDTFSRPRNSQHDRVRPLKEFGSTESVVGAANPDLRVNLANMFFDQILDALVYKGMGEIKGDETKLIPYLQETYGDAGYLFTVIPTMEGDNSCFRQDLTFNRYGFDGKSPDGKSFADQMTDVRKVVRGIGSEFPGLKLQAKIVDHVFGKSTEMPLSGMDTKKYLDISTGIKPGIVTDYKTDDIAQNLRDQAKGTESQARTLRTLKTNQQLLHFFGIK